MVTETRTDEEKQLLHFLPVLLGLPSPASALRAGGKSGLGDEADAVTSQPAVRGPRFRNAAGGAEGQEERRLWRGARPRLHSKEPRQGLEGPLLEDRTPARPAGIPPCPPPPGAHGPHPRGRNRVSENPWTGDHLSLQDGGDRHTRQSLSMCRMKIRKARDVS